MRKQVMKTDDIEMAAIWISYLSPYCLRKPPYCPRYFVLIFRTHSLLFISIARFKTNFALNMHVYYAWTF